VGRQELELGLKPLPVEGGRTRQVCLADALENGAGYCRHLGQDDVLRDVFDEILGRLRPHFEQDGHASGTNKCDASCPDCLRSYDNRLLHSMLNWRLALDMAEIATGSQLRTERWLGWAPELVETFVSSYQHPGEVDHEQHVFGALQSVRSLSCRRSVLFIHPLWLENEDHLVAAQQEARDELLRSHPQDEVRFVDLYSLQQNPDPIAAWVNGHSRNL
jgi:DEAD/DEAH box helicase domain-containing protein